MGPHVARADHRKRTRMMLAVEWCHLERPSVARSILRIVEPEPQVERPLGPTELAFSQTVEEARSRGPPRDGRPYCAARAGTSVAAFGVPRPVTGSQPVVAG